MSSLYEQKPNSVKIVMTDDSGDSERFVVGLSLDEVVAVIEASFGVVPGKSFKAKKARKPRRTKAEMAAAAETNGSGDTTEIPEGVAPSHRRSKKELVGAGSGWPK